MNRLNRLALAATLAAGSALAGAQPATQSIEVRGSAPVRTDVRTLCADVDRELPDTLARIAREVGEPATVDVRFELDGTRIASVQPSGGPRAYRKAVRLAVSGLQCDNGGAGRQTVQFRVRFVDPYAASGQGPVALVETAAPRR